jgi:hypothetical protein
MLAVESGSIGADAERNKLFSREADGHAQGAGAKISAAPSVPPAESVPVSAAARFSATSQNAVYRQNDPHAARDGSNGGSALLAAKSNTACTWSRAT